MSQLMSSETKDMGKKLAKKKNYNILWKFFNFSQL